MDDRSEYSLDVYKRQLNFNLDTTSLNGSQKDSLETTHAKPAEGKKPNRLLLWKRSEPL